MGTEIESQQDPRRGRPASQAITATLASLGDGSARESTAIDDTTNLYLDAIVYLALKLATGTPASDKATTCTPTGRRTTRTTTTTRRVLTLRSRSGRRRTGIFEAPRYCWTDPKLESYQKLVGTSDLYFCDRVIKGKLLATAGRPRLAKSGYRFLVDTGGVRCGHIDRSAGTIFLVK